MAWRGSPGALAGSLGLVGGPWQLSSCVLRVHVLSAPIMSSLTQPPGLAGSATGGRGGVRLAVPHLPQQPPQGLGGQHRGEQLAGLREEERRAASFSRSPNSSLPLRNLPVPAD